MNSPESLPLLPAAVEVAIYRIIEEALANIINHAQAKNGLVMLVLVDGGIQTLKFANDGVGMPEGYRRGIGLNSMRERATELGGKWSCKSDPWTGNADKCLAAAAFLY